MPNHNPSFNSYEKISFNPEPPTILHLDLNSCFATVEQQANPLLRGKPIAVAAYTTPNGCVLAPSIEAKRLGVTVGMRVREARLFCPTLIVLPPDPWKYRFVNRKLLAILREYTADVKVKSIDEMVLNFTHAPTLPKGMKTIAAEIKRRIREEIGEWITVSVGIATNQFLAKTAAGIHKPDGLDVIDGTNFAPLFKSLPVEKLCGIKLNNMARLNRVGVFTAWNFYQAPLPTLTSAFQSICGYYWYLRMHGYEIDDVTFGRKSFGNSYALPKFTEDRTTLSRLMLKLVQKTGRRLREAGYGAYGVHVTCTFADYSTWHHGHRFKSSMYASEDIYKRAIGILFSSPLRKPVRILAVSCFNLEKRALSQLTLLTDEEKKRSRVAALDTINNRYGEFTVMPARLVGMQNTIIDRIAFGGVKELEELLYREPLDVADVGS